MRQLYTVLFYLLVPAILLRLLWRSLKSPGYRRRWNERFGLFCADALQDTLWIHAVSVGEVQACEPLVRRILEDLPEQQVVITTTTPTGSERVKKLFLDRVHHCYFPFDIPLAIDGFIRRVKPRTLVMIETEIWPNLLAVCERRGVSTILANARLSAKSARGYARFPSFTRETFRRISVVAAQAEADAERFRELGVEPSQIEITGSIKFDTRLPASLYERAEVLRREWGNRLVWVAASTHEGEDEQVLSAHRRVLGKYPNAMLVLVPRHPERFDKVADLCVKEGFATIRRSSGDACGDSVQVFVGDTMGELTLFIAAADVAFVGGSLVPVGGHNILEPAAMGVPIVFGPNMFNFSTIGSMMLEKDAAVQVADEQQLSSILQGWFGDAAERARVGENGRSVVAENRGAMERLYRLILKAITKGDAFI